MCPAAVVALLYASKALDAVKEKRYELRPAGRRHYRAARAQGPTQDDRGQRWCVQLSRLNLVSQLCSSPPVSSFLRNDHNCQVVSALLLSLGVEGSVIVGKLLEGPGGSYGYNAATNEYEDLVKGGIIDPLKVVRTALLDAASVASLLTTSEAIIVESKDDKPAAPVPGMGGMGDMGGMY